MDENEKIFLAMKNTESIVSFLHREPGLMMLFFISSRRTQASGRSFLTCQQQTPPPPNFEVFLKGWTLCH